MDSVYPLPDFVGGEGGEAGGGPKHLANTEGSIPDVALFSPFA